MIAEIYHREAICGERCKELMVEFSLPNGLVPPGGLEELGFNSSSGFLWIKHNKKKEHKFEQIGQKVIYDLHVTGFLEPCHMKKLTGVKAMELLMQVVINGNFVQDPSSGKISFSTAVGLKKSFPISAFQLEDKKRRVPMKKNEILLLYSSRKDKDDKIQLEYFF